MAGLSFLFGALMFKKGESGNPGGRPKADHQIKELAKKHTRAALATLLQVMRDKTQSGNARVAAANALLDRGWGKPIQEVTGKDGADLIPQQQTDVLEVARSIGFILAAADRSVH